MLETLKNIQSSKDLEVIIKELYGQLVSIHEFVDSITASRNINISIIKREGQKIGYIAWSIEKEKNADLDEEKEIFSLIVDEIVTLRDFRNSDISKMIIEDINALAKEKKCLSIEITLPSQTFWSIEDFVVYGKYVLSTFRVSKELKKKTEFVAIYNKIQVSVQPEIVEVMITKNDTFQLEVIESPKDYRRIIEEGYNPEIVSLLFYIEENQNLDELVQEINSITDWQEYSLSLLKNI